MTNASKNYLNEIDYIRNQETPTKVLARVKRSLLDYIAVTCAGVKFQKEKLNRFYSFSLPEEGAFKAIGMGKNLALK